MIPFFALLLAWDPDKAFTFLESRQQAWADWKPTKRPGGPCLSCHTGLSYLFLNRIHPSTTPRPKPTELIEGVRTRLLMNPAPLTLPDPGAEAVLNLLVLALQRSGPPDSITPPEEAALKQLWKIQIPQGPKKGSWTWVNAALEPMDSEDSAYLGTAFAARALAAFPIESTPRNANMQGYLRRALSKQPLHNRLAFAAFAASEKEKLPILNDLWARQSADGGWTTNSLGPWMDRPQAPPDSGSNAYATAWAAFTATAAGVACTDSNLRKALNWLEAHQDSQSGAWKSVSMNKPYPDASIQEGFMTDAATGYAAAALLSCGRK